MESEEKETVELTDMSIDELMSKKSQLKNELKRYSAISMEGVRIMDKISDIDNELSEREEN